MLQQLLQNSLQFTPHNGKVTVKAQQKAHTIEIIVSDTGCGIEMSDLPHLFEAFFRGRNSAPHHQGAGLGLTVVQSLVQRWHGKVAITSQPERGTQVDVNLPIASTQSTGHRFVI